MIDAIFWRGVLSLAIISAAASTAQIIVYQSIDGNRANNIPARIVSGRFISSIRLGGTKTFYQSTVIQLIDFSFVVVHVKFQAICAPFVPPKMIDSGQLSVHNSLFKKKTI
ncbi:MAG: hypothetical protein IJ603_06165 [Bacteroidales bacterium]|nr:hypothetical protein [Bacteroidales bacterium]